jgi:hypothetical protein
VSKIDIVEVKTSKQFHDFIMLPWDIYRGNKFWVPPLIMDMKKLLNKKTNPFFRHSTADFFLARRDGKTVGRIAAILNNNHNKFHNEQTGFFGFFESIEDPEVAEALLDRAAAWGQERGMKILRGPMNYSTNDTCGLLVEGFDKIPAILMPYNPPYYIELFERNKLRKAMDLYAWWGDSAAGLDEKIIRVGQAALAKEGIAIRTMDMKHFNDEVAIIKRIYNDAWSANWGFVPMTDAEFDHLAKDLKPVVNPKLVLIAMRGGDPIGFSLSLPDLNVALHKINGRLLPFGLPKVLYYSRKIHHVRVITLGVIRSLQKTRGLGAMLYMETFRRCVAAGYPAGEFSWTLENNDLINRGMEVLKGKIYKRYRIYEKEI